MIVYQPRIQKKSKENLFLVYSHVLNAASTNDTPLMQHSCVGEVTSRLSISSTAGDKERESER
jgi:hypothetical protein